MSRSRTVAATALVGLVVACALAGCNGDDPQADPAPTSSPTATSSESSSTSPTAEASPTAPAATGPLLKMPNATINAPEGWKELPDLVDFQTEANPPGDIGAVRLGSLEYEGPTVSLDIQARGAVHTNGGTMKRLPDTEIAGVTFFHITGKPADFIHLDQFGVRYDGYDTSLYFEFRSTVPPADREKVIAESLASFAWR